MFDGPFHHMRVVGGIKRLNRQPEMVAQLHRRLREFGTWQKAGVGPYTEGRDGFVPPKDWIVGSVPASSDASTPAKAGKKKKKKAAN